MLFEDAVAMAQKNIEALNNAINGLETQKNRYISNIDKQIENKKMLLARETARLGQIQKTPQSGTTPPTPPTGTPNNTQNSGVKPSLPV